MSALRAVALAAVMLAGASRAWADGDRVVLADRDPELRRAIEATLAPWHIAVVVDVAGPIDANAAQLRADARTARFVVWREGGELVVFDRARGQLEHRTAPAGALDPVSAAAAALTVKTLMRLPPPSEAAAPAGVTATLPHASPAPALRLDATLAMRIARGLDTSSSARLAGAALVRPFAAPLRFGIAGEIGTPTDVQRGGFKGTWRDWAVLGVASWAVERARWDIEPYVGAGATRSRVDGVEGTLARHERATLVLVRAGIAAHHRIGRVRIGGVVAIDAVAGTPAYTRASSGTKFFEVPPFALAIGVVTAIDLTQ